MRTVAMIVSLFPLSLQAQVGHTGQKDVFAALKDSDYALRQFQDLTARNDLQRWNVDDSTRRGQLEALHAVGQNVAEARSTLSRIQRSPRSISTVDLLEVSQALTLSEDELGDLSHGTSEFQISSSGQCRRGLRIGQEIGPGI
jgi:hypothetical protein